jgi:hypothetical protein
MAIKCGRPRRRDRRARADTFLSTRGDERPPLLPFSEFHAHREC